MVASINIRSRFASYWSRELPLGFKVDPFQCPLIEPKGEGVISYSKDEEKGQEWDVHRSMPSSSLVSRHIIYLGQMMDDNSYK